MGQADVLVIGGGIVGLAIATELRQQGATVTVLSRDFNAAAGHAAAGMLAPSAEGLTGALLDLSQRSLALYASWSRKLEELTGQDTGFWPCGILTPVFSLEHASPGLLSQTAIHSYQPHLNPNVQGGYWYPEEGQVDTRALLQALRIGAQELGVDIQEGVSAEAFLQHNQQVTGVLTSNGQQQAGHYVLAAGAWSSELLPIPIIPRKGQMAALGTPPNFPHRLNRVLYGEHIYIVPRKDGRIVLGATNEDVGFTPHNTPAGVAQLLNEAVRLYPSLADCPLQDCWWGYRPTTPDEAPILGPSQCHNLTLATGHHRNGVLLTPITAKLIVESIQGQPDPLLATFHWERFMGAAKQGIADAAGMVGGGHPTDSQNSTAAPNSESLGCTRSTQPTFFSIPTKMQTLSAPPITTDDDALVIAGRSFSSRLMTGTGKFDNFDTMRASLAASGSQIVTVAVRRVQTNAPGHEGLAQAIDWQKVWMLPNTAGCTSADEAIRVARLGREMAKLLGQEDNNFVKLEVIPDSKYLLPDPIGTLQAAEQLVKEGFAVLPYINADPILAKHLEEAGCATVMPLGSPIGSGQGVRNAANIGIIVEQATIPVVVDAGIGSPSEAAESMEMGADALLINTAIAKAQDPVKMGRAMGLATEAGRFAYLAGRIPVKAYASASSPLTGTITG
ncbi:glycine oxidase ThiO [Leptolyngbyaceae cyanobacterium CCMR0082]|uniref:Thiazole synthase n=1 Tax=Adonisia turfae CCMR0082 TaxID=2304604 RepID=A0A6M0S610_9CYAN|nr:glycine oxidase ThiO [Adonisia turfae]NEZ63800.1 glycine oxidase ThiO [Adonisia turfae CCMR0082]